jgi:hypothetical protein
MRSDKVFRTLIAAQNRYVLCQFVISATRKFRKPGTHIQDMTNDVLDGIPMCSLDVSLG